MCCAELLRAVSWRATLVTTCRAPPRGHRIELAPKKWTPRGLLFLTLWRTNEGRTRSAGYAGGSGLGGKASDRGRAIGGGRCALVGDVEQIAGELGVPGAQGPAAGQAGASAAG